MGISGLSGLIADHREQFTEPFELKNTNVVIDGIDLIRFLYNSSSQEFLNVQFAGNYVSFGRIVSAFFRNLKANNVQAYVILHGAGKPYLQSEDEEQSRDDFRLESLRQMVEYSKVFHETNDSKDNWFIDLFPYLTFEVFRNVLMELSIPCIRTIFGGGATIANVANEVKGPVLSSRSDCYLLDLKHGFGNFAVMYWDVDNIKDDDIIRCEIYRRSTLINMFELKPEVLPFFAAILGTCRRKPGTASCHKLFDTIKRLNLGKTDTSLTTTNMNQFRIVKLLTWLKGKTMLRARREFFNELQDNDLQMALEDTLKWTPDQFNLVDALDCALDHLSGVKCSKRHDQIVEDTSGQRHFMSDKMVVDFMEGNWIKEVVEIKLTREILPQFEIDDYDQTSATRFTWPMLLDLVSLTSESTERDDSKPTTIDWRYDESNVLEIQDFELQCRSESCSQLNYDSVFELDRKLMEMMRKSLL
ncbi:Protein asteroid -like protein 1 [Halotydeus destructor]|nr:Protein asteroid -like protein 1 [Halotydeus destructor]